MAKTSTKISAKKFTPVARTIRHRDFEDLVVMVPTTLFVTMVSKSGLPSQEARQLCKAFKEMKG